MTGKKMFSAMLGGLMMLNIAGAAIPQMAATAEAASHQSVRANDEFNRAIRAENHRHERRMREIRQEYHSSHRLQHEMKKERERHDRKMKEIHRKYYRESGHSTHRR